ncbi:hypothetical protein [Microbacterium lacticum]|uniref:hypothetical protein n=1 Tax=Microbacterium lacticum TaxID=33885 RepID=UPI001476DD93|nr:hypothetical protein [Microbacterium lacticum]
MSAVTVQPATDLLHLATVEGVLVAEYAGHVGDGMRRRRARVADHLDYAILVGLLEVELDRA